jgi:hypothetical protein
MNSGQPFISHRIRRVMRRAAEALNRGEFSVSYDLARRLTEGAPEFEDGWMMLTEALAGDERYQEGMQAIDDAMAVHPGSLPLRIQRCKFLGTGSVPGD